MEVDWTRAAIGAAIGGALGIIIVLGAVATALLVLRRSDDSAGQSRTLDARRPSAIQLGIGAGIVLVSAAIFAVIGDRGKPAPPEAPTSPAATAAAENSVPAPAANTQIDVGGVTLTFAPPEGYCFYPDPLMQSALAAQKKVNHDNVVYTIFGDCEQLRGAAIPGARIHDFGMLMTPTNFMGKTLTRPEFDRIAGQSIDPATVKKTVDERLKDAEHGLQMQSFSPLGALERDDGAIYLGNLAKIGTDSGTFEQASIVGITVIRGRLISYYLFSDYGKDPRQVLQRLLNRTKGGVEAFAKSNQ